VFQLKSPSEVKPFLLHEDRVVRNFALHYFAELECSDPDVMPLVLQGFHIASSDADRRTLLAFSRNFVQTADTMDEIVSSILSNSKFRDLGESLVINAPVQVLQAYESYLSKLSPEARKVAYQHLTLADADTQTLFEKLILHSESGKGRFIPEFDYQFGVYIARELANRSDAPVDAIRQWINTEYPEDYDGYDDIYGCVLAGMFRFEHMVPRLVDYLHLDADLLNEEATRALTRIGTTEIIQRIQSEFAESDWPYRLNAGTVLSTMKHPLSEAAILDQLQHEMDDSVRTMLADGLCKLLSVEGIPVVRQVIDEGYDELMLDLIDPLYANCIINGIDDPELPHWKAHLEESERAYRERQATGSSPRTANGSIGPETVVNTIKVGRNDPCPCGSGKKYKKCCGA
jgi:hypothetical protein